MYVIDKCVKSFKFKIILVFFYSLSKFYKEIHLYLECYKQCFFNNSIWRAASYILGTVHISPVYLSGNERPLPWWGAPQKSVWNLEYQLSWL